MFSKSRTEKLRDQAQDLAHDLTEAIAPHVERARDEITSSLSDAKDNLGPRLADARDQAAPYVDQARERFVKDVVPAVQSKVADARDLARDQASPYVEEARRRGSLAADALRGEPVERRSGRKRKVLLLAVVAGAGAYAISKLTGGKQDNWQSSYTPAPTPAPGPASSSSSSTPSGAPSAATAPSGATPSEAVADSTEEPHPVTTPDSPAESTDVSDKPDPKA